MKLKYIGLQPVFSAYYEDAQHSFKQGEGQEVADSVASLLLRRSDFMIDAGEPEKKGVK